MYGTVKQIVLYIHDEMQKRLPQYCFAAESFIILGAGGCCMLQAKAGRKYDPQGHSAYMDVKPSEFWKEKG